MDVEAGDLIGVAVFLALRRVCDRLVDLSLLFNWSNVIRARRAWLIHEWGTLVSDWTYIFTRHRIAFLEARVVSLLLLQILVIFFGYHLRDVVVRGGPQASVHVEHRPNAFSLDVWSTSGHLSL